MYKGDYRTKEEINKYRKLDQSLILRKLVGLMENPHSKDKVERQLLLMDDFVTTSCKGFHVEDLYYLMELIEMTMQKVEREPRFEPHLRQLLNLCSISPLLKRSSDILNEEIHLIQYFSFFGFIIITAKCSTHKYLMVKSLSLILTRKKANDERCLPAAVANEMIEKSSLSQTISNALEIYHDDFYTNLLQLTFKIAKISDKICYTMLKENVLTIVLTKIDPDWMENKGGTLPDQDNLEMARAINLQHSLNLIGILLTALRNAPEGLQTKVPRPELEALWGLRYALRVLTFNNKRADRNYLLSLLLIFMELFPNALFLQGGIAKDICILAIGSEVGTGGTWASLVHFGTDKMEYDFKRMLMFGVYYCSKIFGASLEITEFKVIETLMKYITDYAEFQWSPNYLCSLRWIALTIFERMMPDYLEEFLKVNIIERLTDLLVYYNKKPYIMDVLISTIMCLNRIFSVRSDQKITDLCAKCDTLKILQDIITSVLKTGILNSMNQTVLLYIFAAIKSIKVNSFRSIFLSEKMLKRMLNLTDTDIRYDPWLMVAVINYVWEMGMKNNELFLLFIDMQGVYLLLDIIKAASFPVKIIGLGLLVDLCEEPSAIPFFVTWRKDGTNLLQLCLEIFREENRMIGVKCDGRGVIRELDAPLMGTYQRELSTSRQRELEQSPSITNLFGSCRPKVYAVLQLLEVRHRDKTEVANEYYKIYNCDLSIEDRITKLLCDNFMSFKLGELWEEVRSCMELLNLALVPMDQYLIDSTTLRYAMLAKDVRKMQLAWLEIERKNEHCTEQEFYNLIRESKLGNGLAALQEIQFIARTTESLFRYSKTMSDGLKFMHVPMTHQTFDHSINVTIIKNQKIMIESDIIIDNTLEKEPILVSPISSNVSIGDYSMRTSNADIEIEMSCKDSDLMSLDNSSEAERQKSKHCRK